MMAYEFEEIVNAARFDTEVFKSFVGQDTFELCLTCRCNIPVILNDPVKKQLIQDYFDFKNGIVKEEVEEEVKEFKEVKEEVKEVK